MGLGYLVVLIASTLSIVGSLFTILTYLLFPDLRSKSQVFAIWLAVAALGYCLPVYFAEYNHLKYFCRLYGPIVIYFDLVAVFTTVVVANIMYDIFATCGQRIQIVRKHYIFVFVAPLILVSLPFTTNHYGSSGGELFCWIKTSTGNVKRNRLGYMWEGVTFFIPLCAALIYNFWVYGYIILRVKQWQVRIFP